MKLDLEQLAGRRVCVAVSGGRDSVCLLHALLSHAAERGMRISAVTCEHGIRKEASLADLAFVRELCAAWGVPLRVFCADVPALARAQKLGQEEAGRNFRYASFARVLADGEADVVATAHHLNDAAETALFRLARGTSLAGMDVFPAREGIVRPLRNATRAEIDAYAALHALPHAEDATNADARYTRNALRLNVFPALEAAVPGAAKHIAAFAARAAEDDALLSSLAEAALSERAGAVCVPVALPPPLFSRACVLALARCGVVRDYTSANVAEAARLKTLQSGRRASMPQGVTAVREGDAIVFLRPSPPAAAEFPFGCGVFQMGDCAGMVGTEPSEGALAADMDAFPAGCVVRTRREGDTIAPFGGGRRTLKKFLTQKKIPARVGRSLPLVARGSEIYAVFGAEIADCVKITERTARRVYLSLAPRGRGGETCTQTAKRS